MLTIELPIRTASLANLHAHWRTRQRRSKHERALTTLLLAEAIRGGQRPEPPLTITLTRIAPRPYDDDNLPAALKAIRDAIADAILPHTAGNARRRWADDNHPELVWIYAQRRGRPKQHAVTISIYTQADFPDIGLDNPTPKNEDNHEPTDESQP